MCGVLCCGGCCVVLRLGVYYCVMLCYVRVRSTPCVNLRYVPLQCVVLCLGWVGLDLNLIG